MTNNDIYSSRWERCARLAPTWAFHIWTDAANRDFVRTFFPEHLRMYDGYNVNIKRVDAIRYFLLYQFGGGEHQRPLIVREHHNVPNLTHEI